MRSNTKDRLLLEWLWVQSKEKGMYIHTYRGAFSILAAGQGGRRNNGVAQICGL
jgi:hypothetical protein